MKRRFWLLAILILAFGLRVFQLGKQSLWYDEGVTWYLTRFSLPELVRWTAADIQPPLYYLLVWGATRLFGQSEFALRFPSVVAGVLSVPVMWQLGRAMLPRRSSAAAAGFIAIAPLMVYYSQEARMYALLVFQSVLDSWLLWQMVRFEPQRHRDTEEKFKKDSAPLRLCGENNLACYQIAYILVMVSALYTHYFTVFLLLAHAGFWLLEIRHSSLATRYSSFAVVFGGIGVLFSPWIPVLLARLGDDPSYWAGALKLPEVLRDVAISFAAGGTPEMVTESVGVLIAAGFAIILLFAIVCRAFSPPREKVKSRFLFLLLWLVIPVAGVILLSYRTPKFNPRYTMLAWPAFALLVASQFKIQNSKFKNKFAICYSLFAIFFIVAAAFFSLNNWFFVPQFSKDDFKHVAQFIRERSSPGDTVLLSSGHIFPVWEYYFGADN